MRTGHCFAGGGGGILADIINGHEPLWAIEWNTYACAVLRSRFPWMHVIEGDIRDVDFRSLAHVDAICGGFPCQDISAAGHGVGITGERSGLYREVIRAVDDLRPSWVFLENSPRIRTKGRHIVIGDLVARGYSWRDGILGAADVGAPHQRDRRWCLATNTNQDDCQAGSRIHGRWSEHGQADAPSCSDYMADAERIQSGERYNRQMQRGRKKEAEQIGVGSCMGYSSSLGLEIPQPGEAGDEQPPATGTCGSVGWWSAEPGMGRVAHGVAHRPHRIKCLGNGQVPLCAAVAWRILGGP